VLEGDAALHEPLLEHIEDGAGAFLAVGPDLNPVLARPRDGRADAAEIEPGTDLLGGLVISALSASCRSIFDTMSKLDSLGMILKVDG
jgi:hypothetical protein